MAHGGRLNASGCQAWRLCGTCGCRTWVSHLLGLLLTSSAGSTVNFTGVLPPICTVGLSCPELTHREGFAHHKRLVSRWYVLLVVGSFVVLVVALAVG